MASSDRINPDRVAVISGATGGLGRVVARRLAEENVRLALLSTDQSKLEQLASELKLPAERWLAHAVDLEDSSATRAAAQLVLGKFGRVDMLLHFVGGWMGGKRVTDLAPTDISEMLQQHLWTTVNLAQAFVPHLVANHWGRIVVVSSPNVEYPPAQAAPYAIGKAAEETLVLTLAEELKRTGVTANVLRVQTIDTQHMRDSARTPENASWTTPEEIAAAILYLCSDAAHVISGARIPVYGGA